MALVTEWLSWYLVVQLLGLLALPLGFGLFRRLPDRGYFVVKPLGILLHSLVLWLGVSCGLFRNDVGGAVLAVLVVAALGLSWGGTALRPGRGEESLGDWLRSHRGLVAVAEVLFLIAFAAWALVRAHDAAADQTERPMDLLFLSGLRASPTFPPHDPWLAGHAISYYYLGHWMLNALGLLASQPPEIAYNLGLACWFGLLISGCFGIGFNLVRLDRPSSRTAALAGGALAALAVGVAGNPQGTLDVLQRHGLDLSALARGRAAHNFVPPAEHWWWWRSSRVLEDRDPGGGHLEVIDEFPAFSYIIGDAHAHLLAMPFALLALSMALSLHLAAREPPGHATGGRRSAWGALLDLIPLGRRGLILLVGVVGALLSLNTWDFPVQWLLVVLACAAAATRQVVQGSQGGMRAWRPAVLLGGVLLVGSFLVDAPYLLSAQSQVEGIRLNLLHRTPLIQLLLMFGPLLLGVLVLTKGRGSAQGGGRFGWGSVLAIALPLICLLFLSPTLALLGALLALVAVRIPSALRGTAAGFAFALLLAGVGLFLVLTPEVLYLQDGFGTRMNTVFKTYYQAWLLLGLATAHGVVTSFTGSGPWRWLGGATLALVASGLLYTGAAVHSVTGGFRRDAPTLDALAYLRRASPEERTAIDWIRRHTPPDALVVQGKGASYAPEQCRVSVATGRATLLGWEGHELQWRGGAFEPMTAGRADALETIYARGDEIALARTLDSWRIDYVVVGPAERRQYGIDAARESRLAHVMDLVFSEGPVRIFRHRGGPAGARTR